MKIFEIYFSSNTFYSDGTLADPFLVVFNTVMTYQLILGIGGFALNQLIPDDRWRGGWLRRWTPAWRDMLSSDPKRPGAGDSLPYSRFLSFLPFVNPHWSQCVSGFREPIRNLARTCRHKNLIFSWNLLYVDYGYLHRLYTIRTYFLCRYKNWSDPDPGWTSQIIFPRSYNIFLG